MLERGLDSSSSSEESETDFEDNGQQFQGEELEAEELPLNNLFGQQLLGIAPNQEPHAWQELGDDAPPPPLPNHPFDQEPLGVAAAIAQEDAPKEFESESENPGSSCLSSESFPLQETEKSQHKWLFNSGTQRLAIILISLKMAHKPRHLQLQNQAILIKFIALKFA